MTLGMPKEGQTCSRCGGLLDGESDMSINTYKYYCSELCLLIAEPRKPTVRNAILRYMKINDSAVEE